MGLLEELKELQERAAAEIAQTRSGELLEQFRIKYLGTKGALKQAMERLKEVPKADKPLVGKLANDVKAGIQALYDQAKSAVGPSGAVAGVDVTLPGTDLRIGRPHIITQTINAITEVFARMGYEMATGPEVEDEWHNFEALNISPSHPARDPLENFYITPTMLLRSQTSTIQTRVMEASTPPVRVFAVGRVYRPDTVDATHSFMFHQVECLYVDRNVTMVDLRTCIDQFCRGYFGPDMQTRFTPSFFPFTEPSAEVAMTCPFCHAKGCPICKQSGWIELGGCGMVDPNVLEAVNYDPEEYTGFAFGLGIERMAMRKHGISDIRLLYENDVRFLSQF